jgi:hypothetical protein
LLFKNVSQIGITYNESELNQNEIRNKIAVQAGMRFPYLKQSDGRSIYDLMHDPGFYALLFSFDNKSLVEEVRAVQSSFPFLRVLDLSAEQKIKAALKVKTETVIVVRPDQYIGLIKDKGVAAVHEYLKKLRA